MAKDQSNKSGNKPGNKSGGTATAETPAQTGTTTKKKGYHTMIIGVSKARKATKETLQKLADSLDCKPSALIWLAVDNLLKNPPKEAPEGARGGSVGSASGFWTVPVVNNAGRATAIRVEEVASRGDVEGGRTFFRYKKSDDKERNRAKNQAIKAAQVDANLIGYKGNIEVAELSEDDRAAAAAGTDDEGGEDEGGEE